MKFLAITYPDGTEPTPEAMAGLGTLMEEGMSKGWLLDTGGIAIEKAATKVSHQDGTFTVTDGPFTEAKELIAGYAILQADSKEEVLELVRRFYETMGGGEGELRQMFGPDEFGPPGP